MGVVDRPAFKNYTGVRGQQADDGAEEKLNNGNAAAAALNEPPISMRQLLEAGVHFGHQTKRWNPKMRPFIFGARNGIHIIDLQHTVKLFRQAYQVRRRHRRPRRHRSCSSAPRSRRRTSSQEEADALGQYFVTNRWLGGTLTNFRTVKGSLERLRAHREDGRGRHLRAPDQEGSARASSASATSSRRRSAASRT